MASRPSSADLQFGEIDSHRGWVSAFPQESGIRYCGPKEWFGWVSNENCLLPSIFARSLRRRRGVRLSKCQAIRSRAVEVFERSDERSCTLFI